METAVTRERLIKSVIDRRLTYLSPSRLESLLGAAETVKELKVPGDFAEFGIALGGSGICLARSLEKGRRYLGFDLFGTIPPPTERDGARPHERYKTIASGKSAGIGGDAYYGYIPNLYEVVRGNFASFECPVDDSRIRLVKGLFEETLAEKWRRENRPRPYRLRLVRSGDAVSRICLAETFRRRDDHTRRLQRLGRLQKGHRPVPVQERGIRGHNAAASRDCQKEAR